MFTFPELMAINCAPALVSSSTSASKFVMLPTTDIAYTPRCERTSSGCGSMSLMQPMAHVPRNPGRSWSKRVRNGVFSIE